MTFHVTDWSAILSYYTVSHGIMPIDQGMVPKQRNWLFTCCTLGKEVKKTVGCQDYGVPIMAETN